MRRAPAFPIKDHRKQRTKGRRGKRDRDRENAHNYQIIFQHQNDCILYNDAPVKDAQLTHAREKEHAI